MEESYLPILILMLFAIAIAGAILYLVLANTGKSAQYYMTVSELHACTSCGTQTVRVAGVVVAEEPGLSERA